MEGGTKKDFLRRSALARRDALPAVERQRRSDKVVLALMNDASIAKAKVILSYQPFGTELDVSGFNEWASTRGIVLAYPLTLGRGIMVAAAPLPGFVLLPGRFGIAEPDFDTSARIQPTEIEVVVVPCNGFDQHGHRLGYGGGYYDRFLPLCVKATKIGVAFATQRIDEDFAEAWDSVLDRVITDQSG